MSLLTIINEVQGSLNQPVSTSIVGSTRPDAILFLNLAKREGRELAKRHDWQNLIVQQTWTTTATQVQSSAFPSDYDRLVADPEIWDRTTNTRLVGPVSSNEWVRLINGGVSGSITGWWRIIGNTLYEYPAPTAGHTHALEYISTKWCQSSGGTAQTTWQADTDTGKIDENLMALGLTWRWLRAKGMDYAEEMATYEREVEKASARDRGIRVHVIGKARLESYPPQPSWSGTISA